MAPLMKAIRTTLEDTIVREDREIAIYTGYVDPEWTYDNFPHGGFIIGLVVDASVRFQSKFGLRDIFQLSAHFITPVEVGECKIYIEKIHSGRSFHNIQVDFVQQNTVKLRTLILFGSFAMPKREEDLRKMTLAPPSPFARTIPIFTHPSKAKVAVKIPQARFKSRMQWSFEEDTFERNRLLGLSKGSSTAQFGEQSLRAGGGVLEWAGWFDWTDDDVIIDSAILSFFSDVFQRLPDLIAWTKTIDEKVKWSYTTLALNIEFKAPIPPINSKHAHRSVGLYSTSKFMRNGLHDGSVEIWTAPSSIGKGEAQEGWRDEQICLAVASQLTLAYPLGKKSRLDKKDLVTKL